MRSRPAGFRERLRAPALLQELRVVGEVEVACEHAFTLAVGVLGHEDNATPMSLGLTVCLSSTTD
jgi:hypothetical protein